MASGYKFVLIRNCFGEFHTVLFLMQVLSSLLLLDYIIVAFLPGISEVTSMVNYFHLLDVCACVCVSF